MQRLDTHSPSLPLEKIALIQVIGLLAPPFVAFLVAPGRTMLHKEIERLSLVPPKLCSPVTPSLAHRVVVNRAERWGYGRKEHRPGCDDACCAITPCPSCSPRLYPRERVSLTLWPWSEMTDSGNLKLLIEDVA
jgi:hypothetical protein